jgi:hypothetical protein
LILLRDQKVLSEKATLVSEMAAAPVASGANAVRANEAMKDAAQLLMSSSQRKRKNETSAGRPASSWVHKHATQRSLTADWVCKTKLTVKGAMCPHWEGLPTPTGVMGANTSNIAKHLRNEHGLGALRTC